MKILNISNSHGEDSVWLLPLVLKAEMPEQEIFVAELYQAYALTEHIQAAKNDEAGHIYKTSEGSLWTKSTNVSIKMALRAQHWDIIMFNESSRHLGLEEKMSQGMVDWFRSYILENIDYEPILLYNMTWANPTDNRFYTDEGRQQPPSTFRGAYTRNYGFDNSNHYNKLVELTQKYLVGHKGFHKIIFNAKPVQYAGEVLGVPQYEETQTFDLYRDYTHISDYARLIVAYNMYCQLLKPEGLTEVNMDTILWQNRAPWNGRNKKLGDITLTEEHKRVLIESVNWTLKNPLSVPTE